MTAYTFTLQFLVVPVTLICVTVECTINVNPVWKETRGTAQQIKTNNQKKTTEDLTHSPSVQNEEKKVFGWR